MDTEPSAATLTTEAAIQRLREFLAADPWHRSKSMSFSDVSVALDALAVARHAQQQAVERAREGDVLLALYERSITYPQAVAMLGVSHTELNARILAAGDRGRALAAAERDASSAERT